MCLYTDQMKPQIAKKDIKVYKVLEVSAESEELRLTNFTNRLSTDLLGEEDE